jgi:dipeptidyl aminopeptidase/acylaminoacyl peptidase
MFHSIIRFCVLSAIAVVASGVQASEPRTEDVAMVARCDGSTQHYAILYPPGFQADKPTDLLIALHGHGSDRWQFIKDAGDEGRAAREAAASRKMLFVSPDYRDRTSWMGPNAEADMLQMLDELKKRFKVTHVIISGASMGGSSSLTFAVLHPKLVDGVVSMNGTANHLEYENFQDAISESFGGPKSKIPLEYKKRSAEYWPERLTMPLAITTSGKDAIVPSASVTRLASVVKKLQPSVLFLYRENESHRTSYDDARTAYNFVLDRVIGNTKEKDQY